MRKRWFALAAAVSLTLVAAPMAIAATGGTAQNPTRIHTNALACLNNNASNPYTSSVVRSTSDPATYASTTWTNVTCGDLTVQVPRGKVALVVVTVAGELACTGPAGQWCEGQVLFNGAIGYPQAGEPSSFSWAHGDPDASAWEAATMIREKLISCPSTSKTATCPVTVQTQTRNHADGYSLWIDDLAVSAVSTVSTTS